jgi:hypothetical protein
MTLSPMLERDVPDEQDPEEAELEHASPQDLSSDLDSSGAGDGEEDYNAGDYVPGEPLPGDILHENARQLKYKYLRMLNSEALGAALWFCQQYSKHCYDDAVLQLNYYLVPCETVPLQLHVKMPVDWCKALFDQGISTIVLELTFPESTPFSPPRVRVVRPKLTCPSFGGLTVEGFLPIAAFHTPNWKPMELSEILDAVQSHLMAPEAYVELESPPAAAELTTVNYRPPVDRQCCTFEGDEVAASNNAPKFSRFCLPAEVLTRVLSFLETNYEWRMQRRVLSRSWMHSIAGLLEDRLQVGHLAAHFRPGLPPPRNYLLEPSKGNDKDGNGNLAMKEFREIVINSEYFLDRYRETLSCARFPPWFSPHQSSAILDRLRHLSWAGTLQSLTLTAQAGSSPKETVSNTVTLLSFLVGNFPFLKHLSITCKSSDIKSTNDEDARRATARAKSKEGPPSVLSLKSLVELDFSGPNSMAVLAVLSTPALEILRITGCDDISASLEVGAGLPQWRQFFGRATSLTSVSFSKVGLMSDETLSWLYRSCTPRIRSFELNSRDSDSTLQFHRSRAKAQDPVTPSPPTTAKGIPANAQQSLSLRNVSVGGEFWEVLMAAPPLKILVLETINWKGNLPPGALATLSQVEDLEVHQSVPFPLTLSTFPSLRHLTLDRLQQLAAHSEFLQQGRAQDGRSAGTPSPLAGNLLLCGLESLTLVDYGLHRDNDFRVEEMQELTDCLEDMPKLKSLTLGYETLNIWEPLLPRLMAQSATAKNGGSLQTLTFLNDEHPLSMVGMGMGMTRPGWGMPMRGPPPPDSEVDRILIQRQEKRLLLTCLLSDSLELHFP